MLFAAPAQAADEVNVDHVEIATDGKVSVLLAVDGLPRGAVPDLAGITVTVNGTPVDATATRVEAGQIDRTAVLALDASNSMRGERFEQAKAAAKAFLETAPPDVRIGLLTFSRQVHDVIEPTTDHRVLADAIDGIELTRGTWVYDAVIEATDLAGTEGARSLLLLSDGEDQGRGEPLQMAVAASKDKGVVVDVVALDQKPANRVLLARISDASGGRVIEAQSSAALEEVFTAQADALASQVLLRFPRPTDTGSDASVEVTVPAGGTTYADSAFVSLPDAAESAPSTVEHTTSPVGAKGLLLGGTALGIGLAGVLVLALMGRRGPSPAERQISAYFGTATSGQGAGKRPTGNSAQPSLRETAVAVTGKVVTGDFETRLAQKLGGAGSSLTAAEWLLLHAGIAIAAAFVGLVLRGGAFMVVMLILGGVVPWLYLKRKHDKRLAAFNAQLAETLTLISGGLSAGLSMPQSVDTVVREGNEPMAGELRRALVEARLGVPLEDALDGIAERMKSEDFAWVVMAIRIQREVGGNLAELLNTVATTLREREYLRRQVKVLSAEGRMSAWVLGGMPIVMFLYMLLVRPDTARVFYTEPMGIALSAVAIGMLLSGFWVMSRLVRIEV